jgi:hypothetical protein
MARQGKKTSKIRQETQDKNKKREEKKQTKNTHQCVDLDPKRF